MHTTELIDEIIHALATDETIETKEQFQILRNSILAKTSERVRRVLRKRAVRSLSGVAVISLLTKFWGCPGKCIYCPTYE